MQSTPLRLRSKYKVYQPTRIDPSAQIGEGTKIGAFCDIGKDVIIGENCWIQAHVTISNGCKIGDNVFIGPNTSLLNDKYMDGSMPLQPVIIDDYVKVGGHCVILPNVRVFNGVVIGAGSVITKSVDAGKTVYGKW